MADASVMAPSDLHEWGNREQNTLVFNYTAACPLKCDFCCYGCGPKRREKIPYALAESLVHQSGAFDDFTSVGFTGGEPLIFVDEVTRLAGIAKTYGKGSTVATSGHWAVDDCSTATILDGLVTNGLTRLNVSFDPSHSKFVPIQNIERIAKYIPQYKIPLYIVSTFYDRESMNSIDLDDPKLGIFHHKKLVAKVGRANRSEVHYGKSRTLQSFTCYRRYYHDLVIFYDGKAYPCCSTFNRASPGLCLGNANTQSFAEIRARLVGSIMFKSMKRANFDAFINVVSKYDAECAQKIRMLPVTGGACAFCSSIFRNPDMYARIYRAFEKYEKDKIQSLLDSNPELLKEVSISCQTKQKSLNGLTQIQ